MKKNTDAYITDEKANTVADADILEIIYDRYIRPFLEFTYLDFFASNCLPFQGISAMVGRIFKIN
ncbi:hypothetical protein [Paenibacillus polymyxa]|uniref:hypothetical protein n=1 Tax=Paenibacillus polymyxa TaxID=1406 RepID=UPI00211D5B08|nr:hypothetical protein [Paenibacillus polymyxa]